MNKSLAVLVLAIALSGCAVTADGLKMVQTPPSADQTAKVKDQLQQNAETVTTAHAPNKTMSVRAAKPGIIWVGTTGPLRTLTGSELDKVYAGYVKSAEKWHPGVEPIMDAASFKETTAGYTSIEIWSIPGLLNRRKLAIVTKDVAAQTDFASTAGSFLVGTTGDMVSARSNDDGMVYVERDLCREDANYRECASKYVRGAFDANTGQELENDLKPKPGGTKIDITTYERLSP